MKYLYAPNVVNPHVWKRSVPFYPPTITDEKKLQTFCQELSKFYYVTKLDDGLALEIVRNLGGCLQMYATLVRAGEKEIPRKLKQLKEFHTDSIRKALDLSTDRQFSRLSIERYELLRDIYHGKIVTAISTPAAENLLAKHAGIDAILGVHPDGHLVFAIPMTRFSLEILAPEILAAAANFGVKMKGLDPLR